MIDVREVECSENKKSIREVKKHIEKAVNELSKCVNDRPSLSLSLNQQDFLRKSYNDLIRISSHIYGPCSDASKEEWDKNKDR